MNFDDPQQVESIAYDLKLGDWPRALNRARINDAANGAPPYTDDEVKENNIAINVSDLEHTRKLHDARSQLYSALSKPAHYFQARTDAGPKHKRQEWNTIATSKAASIMKRSLPYFESVRSRLALDVLHGVGPSAYEDRDHWCPDPLGIEDVLIPSDTLLSMKNLPFFFLYRSYTAPELIRLTRGPKVDPGWDLEMVQSCLEWMDSQMMQLRNNDWPEAWSPEKAEERIKSNGGWYAGDQAPKIDCFDFYFWTDEEKTSGWRRRIILDPWSTPVDAGAGKYRMQRRDTKIHQGHGFLFNPGSRKYADKVSEIVTFQFADLSAVAPFRYHTRRSLGWLLYAVCHMQNRLRCRMSEHTFEAMMQYFTGASEEEFQRALRIELTNRAFIDKSIKFIPPSDRWQINPALVELAMNENRRIIQDSSASWTQNTNYSQDRTEKTKFQVMAEVGASTAMINSALLQVFCYQEAEYREIFRRLCKPRSRDPDCREFRAHCLRQGIPEGYLVPEAWEIESEHVMGAGNKSMEMAIAEWLMNNRMAYGPGAQQEILRDATLLVTDDAVRTRAYVPDGPPSVSNSQHDAQLSLSTILMGGRVDPVDGQNHKEVIGIWMSELSNRVASVEQRGGMANPQELAGMKNLSQHVKFQLGIVAGDENEKQYVKEQMDILGKLDNFLKAYEQRLVEAVKKSQQQQGANGQMDPKDASKIQATIIGAQVKAENQRMSHAQRMAQRQLQFEQQQRQEEQRHLQERRHEHLNTLVGVAQKDIETAATVKRNRLQSFSE